MMIELLRQRRSIRKFTDKKIEPAKIDILKEALLRSPSSRNIKPWRFLFVEEPELIQKLSLAKPHGSSFFHQAPMGIVICADESASDVWVEDCSIAAILAQLTAQSLDLGSCWIQIRKRHHSDSLSAEEYILDLLKLPKQLKVACIIAIGYPAEKKIPVPHEDLDYSRIL